MLFVFFGGDIGASAAWNLNRPSLRSGHKVPSAPDGAADPRGCFICTLHIASHPNRLHQKQKRTANAVRFVLVETVGIEPMTSCMSSMRSNQLSYASATDDIIAYAKRFVKGF